MGRKSTKEERLAQAAANGYERWGHRDKDSVRDQNKYKARTIQLQDEASVFYKEHVLGDSEPWYGG